MDDKMYCSKCKRMLKASDNFFTYKDGRKTEMCKKCLTMHIDNFKPETFLWLLEKMDVPYIPEEWNVIRDKAYAKDPLKMNGMSVFGKYLSKMRLNQFKEYGWKDTDRLLEERKKRDAAEQEKKEEYEKQIQADFEAGKITESEYRTLVSTETQKECGVSVPLDPITGLPIAAKPPEPQPFSEPPILDSASIPDPSLKLSEDEKLYLAMKWGRFHSLNDCIEMEKKYTDMKNSFDIQDSDTEGTLIFICKTYLKMNQAIDSGDIEAYQKLSRVYNDLRKTAKFTAAQNKDQQGDFLNSAGQLVAYCEEHGGRIPRYEIKEDYDVLDTIIKDLKNYNYNLIKDDPSITRQIEDYIKRKENLDKAKRDKLEAEKQGLEAVPLNDEDYVEHYKQQEEDKEKDERENQ
nr:MAG TPA: hypothetical protein [Caudoviricetes sp.]